MLARQRPERLVCALEDSLGADIDPTPGRHLAVHREPLSLEIPEHVPCGPTPNEIRVRDQHARRLFMGPKHAHRLAGLHEQRLVVAQCAKRTTDRIERFPRSSGLARPAVDDQVIWPFGDLGVEVVHQHSQRGLLHPPLAA